MDYIIKRDGRKVQFNRRKIERVIEKAFEEVDGEIDEYAEVKISNIADYIQNEAHSRSKELTVEEIQDLVENGLMNTKRKDVARAYITYRNERNRVRGNSIDKTIEEIAEGTSEYWLHENSNKSAGEVTTQRDYFAGAVSEDYTMRKLLPKDVVTAHKAGQIHFHDADYFAQNALSNCCLINLEDMLQNGTVVNKMMIEKPHRFITAATIATQIILGVSSSQYGGCTISLTHLAPFIRDSFIRYFKESLEYIPIHLEDYEINEWFDNFPGYDYIKEHYKENYRYAMNHMMKEVNAGVQTFNYQVNSMSNTNG